MRVMRPPYVCAAALTAVLAASPVKAQRPVRVDVPGEMAAASLSELPRLPSDTLAAMLAYVQGLPASLIDPELPAIDIGQWLAAVLWPKVSGPPRIPDWQVEFCRSRTSDAPGFSADLCAHTSVELSDELGFRFEIRIAAAVQTPDGAVRWVVDTPSVQQIRLTFVGPRPADSDSLDIPSLRDLREWLELPRARWPKVDLQTSVEATRFGRCRVTLSRLPSRSATLAIATSNVRMSSCS